MPTTRSKTPKKPVRSEKAAKADREAIVVAENPRPVFETFTADIALQEGLSIVRSLGAGKYEVVNLKYVDLDLISSGETGRMIKDDPERLKVIELDDEDWEVAKLKCGQAVSSANAKIFRFKKLPLELRYEVYGLIITASKPIHLRGEPDENLGFALMRTCRQIYEETLPFFYRNNFSISELSPKLKLIISDIQTNLREVTFDWRGYKIKDRATLKMFLGCSRLKVLHIKITKYCVTTVVDPHARRQWLYQDDVSIKKFNRLNGFDNLVRLRGLDRVSVRNSKYLSAADVSNQEIADFEAFLMRILTQPKPGKQLSILTHFQKRVTRSTKTAQAGKVDNEYRP